MKRVVGLVLSFHLLRQGLSVSAAHGTAHSRLWPGSYPVHTSCLAVVVLGLQVSITVPLLWVQGVKFEASGLCDEGFYQLSHLPSLQTLFLAH